VWGSGEHLRDYIFIHDVVDAHLKALEYCLHNQGKYHYFNLSAESPTSVLEIVKYVEKYLGKSATVKHFPARPGDPLKLYADASKAQQELGWSAQVSLEEGVKQTVEYFVNFLHTQSDASHQ
jgi:UDP-glucose 4-epimerase